jgi:hypothetical protein
MTIISTPDTMLTAEVVAEIVAAIHAGRSGHSHSPDDLNITPDFVVRLRPRSGSDIRDLAAS